MKLKKFFAGVLAAAMMLTVGATSAFATTPDTISVKKMVAKLMRRCLQRAMTILF